MVSSLICSRMCVEATIAISYLFIYRIAILTDSRLSTKLTYQFRFSMKVELLEKLRGVFIIPLHLRLCVRLCDLFLTCSSVHPEDKPQGFPHRGLTDHHLCRLRARIKNRDNESATAGD